jgi:hypothetical protein
VECLSDGPLPTQPTGFLPDFCSNSTALTTRPTGPCQDEPAAVTL